MAGRARRMRSPADEASSAQLCQHVRAASRRLGKPARAARRGQRPGQPAGLSTVLRACAVASRPRSKSHTQGTGEPTHTTHLSITDQPCTRRIMEYLPPHLADKTCFYTSTYLTVRLISSLLKAAVAGACCSTRRRCPRCTYCRRLRATTTPRLRWCE